MEYKKSDELEEIEFPQIHINKIVENEKFVTLRGLVTKLFTNVSYFHIENLFIDVYSDDSKKEDCAFILLNHSLLDIGDKKYTDKTKKSIEIFNKDYLESAKNLIREYKEKYNEKIELKDST